ncbi:unnamed protein product [Boreogadus saida]
MPGCCSALPAPRRWRRPWQRGGGAPAVPTVGTGSCIVADYLRQEEPCSLRYSTAGRLKRKRKRMAWCATPFAGITRRLQFCSREPFFSDLTSAPPRVITSQNTEPISGQPETIHLLIHHRGMTQ